MFFIACAVEFKPEKSKQSNAWTRRPTGEFWTKNKLIAYTYKRTEFVNAAYSISSTGIGVKQYRRVN